VSGPEKEKARFGEAGMAVSEPGRVLDAFNVAQGHVRVKVHPALGRRLRQQGIYPSRYLTLQDRQRLEDRRRRLERQTRELLREAQR
jgi:hypothetical protein